jgi:hypothetical protein
VTLCGPDVEWAKRLEARQQIAREVLFDHKSLIAAGGDFRRLDDEASSRWVLAPQLFPDAASEDEAYCRSVLAFLRTTSPTDLSGQMADRLQVELNAMFSGKKPHATGGQPSHPS